MGQGTLYGGIVQTLGRGINRRGDYILIGYLNNGSSGPDGETSTGCPEPIQRTTRFVVSTTWGNRVDNREYESYQVMPRPPIISLITTYSMA